MMIYEHYFKPEDVHYTSDGSRPETNDDGNIIELVITPTGYENLRFARALAASLSLSTELTNDEILHLGIYPPGVEAESLGETVQNITVIVMGWGTVHLDVLRDNGGRYEVQLPMEEIKQHFEGK